MYIKRGNRGAKGHKEEWRRDLGQIKSVGLREIKEQQQHQERMAIGPNHNKRKEEDGDSIKLGQHS
jgi:hypothetical protein